MIKKTIVDCQIKAKENNGKCLSIDYINSCTKMLWECSMKHRWRTKFGHINSGHWCPKCSTKIAHKKQKLKNGLIKAKSMAYKKGGKCLSSEYTNFHTKMLWECKNKHMWKATYGNIYQGYWCPYCAGQIITIKDCQIKAQNMKGKCISKKYKNAHKKLLWECKEKHKWWANYNCIQQGRWCPECSCGKTQRFILNIITEIFPNFNVYSDYRKFKWLKLKTNKQELDIYVSGLKLAIEYDGEQHFIPVRFGNMPEKEAKIRPEYIKKLDKIKNKKIREHPEDIKYFIRFSYKEPITREYIFNKIKRFIKEKI